MKRRMLALSVAEMCCAICLAIAETPDTAFSGKTIDSPMDGLGMTAYSIEVESHGGTNEQDIEQLKEDINGLNTRLETVEALTIKSNLSPNLFDKASITEAAYWRHDTGYQSIDDNDPHKYFLSDYIMVTPGDTVWLNVEARFVTPFDTEGQFMPGLGAEYVRSYIVPDGVKYIRLTLYAADQKKDIMVNVGESPLPYNPYGTIQRPELLKDAWTAENLAVVRSLCGGGAVMVAADSLTAGTRLEATDFPYNLKKGVGMTFYAQFSTFTSVTVGKGYGSYRGDAVRVTENNIEWVHYGNHGEEHVRQQIPHGLTMKGFIALHWHVGNDMTCRYTIETMNQMVSGAFDSPTWTEMNGIAFAAGEQNMESAELKAVALDIKCPMWLFGDSYFGVSGDRVIGQLKNLGYFDGLLIVGLAGMASNGAYMDNLEKLIRMGGMPRYIVWCEGMNASAEIHAEYIDKLLALKEQYGFELILYKVPTVPDRTDVNNANNEKILSTGCRYVDAYKAVGTDDAGSWYSGYLSSDGIHPTEIGARAIANRIIIDVPEIMQYGYAAGSVGGTTSGDR